MLIVIKKKDLFSPELYGSVKAIHDNENVAKNNVKYTLATLQKLLKDKDFWQDHEYVIIRKEVIRATQKNKS